MLSHGEQDDDILDLVTSCTVSGIYLSVLVKERVHTPTANALEICNNVQMAADVILRCTICQIASWGEGPYQTL